MVMPCQHRSPVVFTAFVLRVLNFPIFHPKPVQMKNALISALGCLLLLVIIPVTGTASLVPPSGNKAVVEKNPEEGLIKELLALTPRKYYTLTGKKMSLKERISLRWTQWKIKKMLRKGKAIDLTVIKKAGKSSDFNLPGFALGAVLSLLGVLIAYLIDKTDTSLIKWAWIGAAAGAVIILLSVIL